MYAVKPANDKPVIDHVPTCMYTCKSLYEGFDFGSGSTGASNRPADGSLDLGNLNKDASSQLRRLLRLQDKMNQFCDDLKLGHLATTASCTKPIKPISSEPSCDLFPERMANKKNTKAKAVEDLVIHVAAGSIPYSILTAFTQLATRYKCFIQFFVHGSAASALDKTELAAQKNKIKALQELFGKLKLTPQESRSCYDYSVTLIWKKMEDQQLGPALALDTKTTIYGESNILRYFNRLGNSTVSSMFERDSDLMDKCTNELHFQTDKATTYLCQLDKNLGNDGKFLAFGEKAGLVDLYVWSMLRQAKVDTKKLTNVASWMKLVEGSQPMLQMIVEA